MCSATMCLKEPFKVGYALVLKKQRSFIQPSFVEYARSKGIELICIDLHRPLAEQGPFDAILHKLSGEEWNRQLLEYEQNHPGVMIIDPPEAIERLHNRISMLQAVSELQVTDERETFGIPKQSVVDRSEGLSDQKALSGLKFPIIAKPLVADGSAKSHHMSLIFNQESLAKLKPPLVLQEFVNHGGVIFKVYVVGDHVKCVRRRSLPDVDEDDITESEAPLAFSQISNISNRASAQQSGESFGSDFLHGGTASLSTEFLQAELPPSKFVQDLAKGLRRALGLRLFNFDLIRDTKIGNHYHVIDINYFPGYAKMPAYESVLTDFFLGLAKKKAAKEASDGIEPVSDSKATAAIVN